MNQVNNATLIKRKLITRLSQHLFDDDLEGINRIPLDMFPKNSKSVRCCIHKDRAIQKYRLMAMMGFSIEDEEDELKPLSKYAKEAMERETIEYPILTVIDDGCSSCIKTNYHVTDACRGCVARPCMFNCPKDAISMVDGHAKIDHEKCINCGICKNVCPYHAIIFIPVPCEEACPVDAISKDENGKEKIDYTKCISCGKCLQACPFGAMMERSQIVDVIKTLKSGTPTVALIAPSIVGQFSATIENIVGALKKIGFDKVVEVAHGADLTAKHEAAEWVERHEAGEKFMTTSCCPAYYQTVKKHIPELEEFVSTTPSPMALTAEWTRENYSGYKQVFVGPCIAKRAEAILDKTADMVITYEELGSMFISQKIDVQECEAMEADKTGKAAGRGFPVTGGVAGAVQTVSGSDEIKAVHVDGLTAKSIREMKRYPKSCPGNLVEVMSCEGGCMAGPGVICNPKLSGRSLKKLLENTPS